MIHHLIHFDAGMTEAIALCPFLELCSGLTQSALSCFCVLIYNTWALLYVQHLLPFLIAFEKLALSTFFNYWTSLKIFYCVVWWKFANLYQTLMKQWYVIRPGWWRFFVPTALISLQNAAGLGSDIQTNNYSANILITLIPGLNEPFYSFLHQPISAAANEQSMNPRSQITWTEWNVLNGT